MNSFPRGVQELIDAVGDRLDDSPLAVMLDVDGTLAPIAPTPGQASVPPATRDVLRRLVALPRTTLALVSGRSAEDAWKVAGVDGAWVIGNHGFELRRPDGRLTSNREVAVFESAITEAAHLLEMEFGAVQGAIVENKRWTLSMHYRLVHPDVAPKVVQRARQIADVLGLQTIDGRKIVELRPPIQVDKGTMSVALAHRIGALGAKGSVIYAGDDRTDEDAFRALRARNPRTVTVRILTTTDDRPNESSAEFVLESPEELRATLEWLVARRSREQTRA